MSNQRKDISKVFTPRSENVNLEMYVKRPELENELLRSIKGSMNTLISGESGNGKSWLYKKVIEGEDINFAIANCANASRFSSLTNAIYQSIIPTGSAAKTGYAETKKAEVKAVVFDGSLEHKAEFKINGIEPLLESFQRWRRKTGQPVK